MPDSSTIRLVPTSEPEPVEALRHHPAARWTVRDLARRPRISEDQIRAWSMRGELKAINTATVLCGGPRWIVTPEALAAFEKARTGGPPQKPPRRRRKVEEVDFYPG